MAAERDRHLFGSHPKRILSLDGGGVRGLIALGMLKQVETVLADRSPDPANFRLSDYFDLIGGTSTGAVIGTMLAMGMRVDRIIEIYFNIIPDIFSGPRTTAGYHTKFDSRKFEHAINETFDDLIANDLGREDLLQQNKDRENLKQPILGSDVLKTGLAIIAKRIDTSSVWVVTNNPRSKYWEPENEFWLSKPIKERENFIPNRDYALRDLVQATASAPYYLEAVDIMIDDDMEGLFLDGGVTPHNNPSAELFLTVTLQDQETKVPSPTGFSWPTGADNLFMLSLGCGRWNERIDKQDYRSSPSAWQAGMSLHSIINDGMQNALTWLQAISEPAYPEHIDGNLERLAGLMIVDKPLLTFQRLDPVLERSWLREKFQFKYDIMPEAIEEMRQMDNADLSNLNRCLEVGREYGFDMVKPELFPAQFDQGVDKTNTNEQNERDA